jgi:hypothetical protein
LLKGLDNSEYSRPPQVLKQVSPDIVKDLNLTDSIIAAVEKIVAHETLDGVTIFLVKWKDLSGEQNTWLKKEDFIDIGPIIAYEKSLAKPPKATPVVVPKSTLKQSRTIPRVMADTTTKITSSENPVLSVASSWSWMQPNNQRSDLIGKPCESEELLR